MAQTCYCMRSRSDGGRNSFHYLVVLSFGSGDLSCLLGRLDGFCCLFSEVNQAYRVRAWGGSKSPSPGKIKSLLKDEEAN